MRRSWNGIIGAIVISTALGWPLAANALTVQKTVSTNGMCPGADSISVHPGTLVTYCYTIFSNDPVTYTTNTLNDDVLGPIPLPNGGMFDLGHETPPITVTAQANIQVSTVNTATLTANPGAATATDTAQVLVIFLSQAPAMARGAQMALVVALLAAGAFFATRAARRKL